MTSVGEIKPRIIFEACVESLSEAKKAVLNGAHRIELCCNNSLTIGGTTPSKEAISQTKFLNVNFGLKVNVIIRPRGGNFMYSSVEFEKMKKNIIFCKSLGVNGVVFGCLTKNKEIDLEKTKELVKIASPLSTTFHMAFDEIDNKKKAISTLINLGVDRILTKGGKRGSAIKNLDSLKDLVDYSKGKIIIMPGSGVRKDNYKKIKNFIPNITEFHGTKIVGDLNTN